MAFRRNVATMGVPEDPEQLYRLLSLTNDGPEALWAHQADVLRDWHGNHLATPDVAIELPTGAGKTLVGGLIGEFQRRAEGDRVAYLCPTRQLARQTSQKLTEYGISNVLLVNRVVDWNPLDRSRYAAGQAIAVSVYSHVFNSNPGLGDAQLLLLDDAHAAEGYVASPWSLEIAREDHSAAYDDVLSALAQGIHPLLLGQLRTPGPEAQFRGDVYMVSPAEVSARAGQLESILATAAATASISRDAKYALAKLAGHLDQCLVYISVGRILIRPLIPPTMSHPAFNDPARRVYMSATLGSGGELERSFGRRNITRIPIPKGWEKQGTGRRLFTFPELAKDMSGNSELVSKWVSKTISEFDRVLVLTPDRRTALKVSKEWLPAGTKILSATDVEDDLDEFTAATTTALVLNNRYDGIDLPDDNCRLVILSGLPARGDLQERFLYGTVGAMEVLQERIRARIVQGAGRATRNARDFATVIVMGNDLVSYVVRRDVQQAMHPEVHAELEFGYQQSAGITADEMSDQVRIFTAHGDEWREVDGDIVAARATFERIDPSGAAELQLSVLHEVATYEAIWQGEWERALKNARQAIDALRGGRAPQRYAAFWNYLASWIAQSVATRSSDPSFMAAAAAFDSAARSAGRGTLWLTYLPVLSAVVGTQQTAQLDALDEAAMSAVIYRAHSLGGSAKFEAQVQATKTGLGQKEHKEYERALVTVGQFAGASEVSGDGNNDSAPDAVWVFDRVLWVGWEAKSEAKADGELGSGDTRQAGGHIRFASTLRAEGAPDGSPVFLVTPQARVHPSAYAVAEEHVFLLRPSDVMSLFDKLVRAWRNARARGIENLSPSELGAVFAAEGALPTQWLPVLMESPMHPSPISG